MANTEPARAIEIGISARVEGLNHIAALRGKFFPANGEKDMCRFIDDMRDKYEPGYHDNIRVLSAMFDLADIDKERQRLKFNELTTDEKERLIKAMNKLKAVVSLFPKNLILPL
ncbi:hypothetical protein CS369_02720 [Candidatus Symbiopectobacterium sp. 'North America']|uniref:DUF5347 family protein n=1 Tax=Candidatus Symbiopectobacterium sp. 'North America' TaxID=2794574 RepID=UPI0018C92D34|nr:DUF5347 family protein [Candidatus Symbiopectobacterium sp. 'North America']MBG6244011.1 hypothetical protein [Candidatus Symbiopectobacterium sp. 'North America']